MELEIIKRYEKLGEKVRPNSVKVKKSLRINTLKISEQDLIRRLSKKEVRLTKIPFTENGYFYDAGFSLGATPEYLQGYYYLQEAASQLPVKVLDPKPGELILDMAASPGSKTTQIAQKMNNKGVIIALENNNKRIERLLNNLERLSAKNVIIINKDARKAGDIGIKFDKILLDAPCSGNFCVDKDFLAKRTVLDFKKRAELQKELIQTAVNCLKKGGILIYSTCSLEPEEDELVINWALEKNKDLELLDTNLETGTQGVTNIFGKEINKEISKTRRFWPNKTGTEGFFIAKLKKN